ncbi:MAG: phosphate acetyltransferase [Buchnera aphidicola (Floraphis choui)]
MTRTLMLVPIGINVGLTSVSIGLIQKIQNNNFDVMFFKPIFDCVNYHKKLDHTTEILKNMSSISCLDPIKINNLSDFLIEDRKQSIIESILLKIDSNVKGNDILLLEGIYLESSIMLSNIINYDIVQAINAEVIFVCTLTKCNTVNINDIMEIIKKYFLKKKNIDIRGIIINEFKMTKLNIFKDFIHIFDKFKMVNRKKRVDCIDVTASCQRYDLSILGNIPWNSKLLEPTLEELRLYFQAYIINKHDLSSIFIKSIIIYNKNDFFQYNSRSFSRIMLILSSDCLFNFKDIWKNVSKNNSIVSILLTDSNEFYINFLKSHAFIETINIPILLVQKNIFQIILLLRRFNFKISIKNFKKFNEVKKYISFNINDNLIVSLKSKHICKYQICPSVFIYNLRNLARKKIKKIILPEGNELRIIRAASICSLQGIARCVLLGNPGEIRKLAKLNNIKFNSNIEILNPILIKDDYIKRFVQLRSKYGITEIHAKKILNDYSILSTLILESNKVDGLVSGSINTTSSTILPALQLIKTSESTSLISSVFFMLLQDHVLLYADCAINPNPNSNQLAEIAIQSANTAISFGVIPKIAMLSYATGISGSGTKVDKVKEATDIVRNRCPNLIIEGPIQYDAAIDSTVSKLKCPNSSINGSATVFIFPDLDSGNIAYKAVQRSTNSISIGPILQGIKKPVNDLSRGASVQDIVYTIAITAIQSE